MAINILIAGDVVPFDRTKPLFDEKQTRVLFGSVIPLINKADFSVVNFEAPVVLDRGEPIKKSGPHLSSTFQTMEVIKEAGFKMITLANNHFRDQGEVGVRNTLDSARKLNLEYVGGGENFEHARRTKYVTISDKRFAFLNFCEQEYSIATDEYGGSNPYDIIDISRAIHEARKSADYVVLIIHGGIEHYQLPSPRMKKEYRFFVDAGADVVVNHHQHCFSGYEIFKGKLICYGLGNFCFDRAAYRNNGTWGEGILARLTFEEGNVSLSVIPYSQCAEEAKVVILEEGSFDRRIAELNAVIANDEKLEKQYEKWVKSKQKKMITTLNAFGTSLFDKFYKKGYLGNLHKKKRLYVIKDLLYCESHLDVLKNAVNDYIKEKN